MNALVPDDLWAVIELLLPPEPEEPKGGRPRTFTRDTPTSTSSSPPAPAPLSATLQPNGFVPDPEARS